jgi:glycosyltransferase involved in cell wall biosynthesis
MLSVIIITKNETRHIAACLKSVAWADEIIVLDSGSSDDTVAICKTYSAQVYETDWPGFGPQKQRALDKAREDWVFSIDADEQVTPQLKEEIQQAMQSKQFAGYQMPRLSSFCGKQIRHGGWWPDYIVRLFRRESAGFLDVPVHEKVLVDGPIGKLKSPLLHDTYQTLEEAVDKMNTYSSLSAKMLFDAGKKSSISKTLIKTLWTFVRCYLIKAAFLEGRYGLMLAAVNSQGTFYKYLKLLELQHKQ